MLAALGFPIAEQFHPLFATDDAPSFSAFQQTPLQTFWPAVVLVIAVLEVFSVFTFQNPASRTPDGEPAQPWTIRLDHEPGDLGWDPLGLKPTDPAELKEMQTKELNNGRLAMIAAAGMIVQELATGNKLATFALMGKDGAKNFDGEAYAKTLPGILPLMGFWDPLGFCSDEKLTN